MNDYLKIRTYKFCEYCGAKLDPISCFCWQCGEEAMIAYDFIALDFETANRNNDSACSIGLAFVKNSKIVLSQQLLIQPPNNAYSKTNIDIHGITPEETTTSESFNTLGRKIMPMLINNIIVSHNAQFDMSVLHCCFSKYNIPIPEVYYMDSISISGSAVPPSVNKGLVARLRYFDIELENHHDAACDAIGSALLVLRSLDENFYPSLRDYAKHNASQLKRLKIISPDIAFKKKNREGVRIGEICCANENIDVCNPLYNKICVVTGEFARFDRREALQAIADKGGIIRNNISGKTDYLFVGVQDLSVVGSDGMSNKEEQAHEFIAKGKKVKILTENDLIEMLNQ